MRIFIKFSTGRSQWFVYIYSASRSPQPLGLLLSLAGLNLSAAGSRPVASVMTIVTWWLWKSLSMPGGGNPQRLISRPCLVGSRCSVVPLRHDALFSHGFLFRAFSSVCFAFCFYQSGGLTDVAIPNIMPLVWQKSYEIKF